MTKLRLCLLTCFCISALARPAEAAPGPATLLTPNGYVTGSTIAFTWDSVPDSTWYLFWLGSGSPTSYVMQQWYTAEQAGCANGGTCTITLTPPILPGSHVWFIQTWGGGSGGPWSAARAFVMRDAQPTWSQKLPTATRFTLTLDGAAVLDNETGLTWERLVPNEVAAWSTALDNCMTRLVGGRRGWHLPSVSELATLTDGNSGLPAGHPFQIAAGGPNNFWSQTTNIGFSAFAMLVSIRGNGDLASAEKTLTARYMCVRAPGSGPYQ